MSQTVLIQKIDAILPQTQCTKCGYDGCLPYATAIAEENAPINRCPPGGDEGIAQLANLLQTPPLALDPECGEHTPLHLAFIDETHCIGCTLCIKACPVDAIIGANKFMHTVIEDLCSGCELCIPVCPVDCIQMKTTTKTWKKTDAHAARARHQHRKERLAQQAQKEDERLNQRTQQPSPSTNKAAAIAQALALARARRQHEQTKTS